MRKMRKMTVFIPDVHQDEFVRDTLRKYPGCTVRPAVYADEISDDMLEKIMYHEELHCSVVSRKTASIHMDITSLSYDGHLPEDLVDRLDIAARYAGAVFQQIYDLQEYSCRSVFIFTEKEKE